MPQKYYNVKETAGLFGLTEADVKAMIDRREIHGYRDGANWKFKAEDIERMAKERAAESPSENAAAEQGEGGDVLLSEFELGHSEAGTSGTVIGSSKRRSAAESDIRLAGSDIKLADEVKAAAPKDEVANKVSQFEELDLTLDQDLALEDASHPSSKKSGSGDSTVDLSGKKLEDDDLVLGGGAGSDIAIGGDSGISLVDPADSGLSLESPLNLTTPNDESLELGEDDLLSFSTDTGSGTGLKSEDDFQLTPMEEGRDTEDSESGSQVIALDTEGEANEAVTMLASGAAMAGLLGDANEPALGLATDGGRSPLALHPETLAGGVPMGGEFAMPEAPYSALQIVGLAVCTAALVLVGMIMYDLVRNSGTWDSIHPLNSTLMDTILGWFEK